MTADRYLRIFRELGWRARILPAYDGEPADCIVGLHAKKSARAVLAFRKRHPDRKVIVVLTGTDLYRDIKSSRLAQHALDAADVLVTLQPVGIAALPARFRSKAVSIVQSAPPYRRRKAVRSGPFCACVLGHVRREKDPLRAAYAVRRISKGDSMRVVQAGKILEPRYERLLRQEAERNPHFRYAGALGRRAALALLARCDLLVQSSYLEGGANSICEAIACGVPILASRISGNIGILGRSYPGLYPPGDTKALRGLLERAMQSPRYYERLQRAVDDLLPLVQPSREQAAWHKILKRKAQPKA